VRGARETDMAADEVGPEAPSVDVSAEAAPEEFEAPASEPAGDGHAEEVEALTAAAERAEPIEAERERPSFPQGHAESEAVPEAAPAERPAKAEEVFEPAAPEPAPPPEEPDDGRPKRTGWWSRKSSFF
jgi:ribonuclease E